MNAYAYGTLIKRSFDDLAEALCRASTLLRHQVLKGGEIRLSARRTRRHDGRIQTTVRVGSSSSRYAWPARHPAEKALLVKHASAHCHRSPLHGWHR